MQNLSYISLILSPPHFFCFGGFQFSSMNTSTVSWHIEHHSATVGFDSTGSVDWEISPVAVFGGIILSPYHSYCAHLGVNDVRIRERTLAFEGQYSSEEVMRLRSKAENDVNFIVTKPAGGEWTINWNEIWPVILNASRAIDYAG